MQKSVKDLVLGVHHHPIKTFGYIFTAFSVINTLSTGLTHFIPGVKFEGPVALVAVVLISTIFGLNKVWKPSKVEIPIANCNTTIEVLFGDLFEQPGYRAIAVNDFFDSEIGKPVSERSIHGIFLKEKCNVSTFDEQLEEQLSECDFEKITKKTAGKTNKFPIGTTALIKVNKDSQYIVFAFAKSDPETCKTSSDVTMMWKSLHELWQRARIETGGHELNLPLVGSGLSGIGLPTRDLLNLIILSTITETKSNKITERIRIILHSTRFEDLDLRDVKKYWRE